MADWVDSFYESLEWYEVPDVIVPSRPPRVLLTKQLWEEILAWREVPLHVDKKPKTPNG